MATIACAFTDALKQILHTCVTFYCFSVTFILGAAILDKTIPAEQLPRALIRSIVTVHFLHGFYGKLLLIQRGHLVEKPARQ